MGEDSGSEARPDVRQEIGSSIRVEVAARHDLSFPDFCKQVGEMVARRDWRAFVLQDSENPHVVAIISPDETRAAKPAEPPRLSQTGMKAMQGGE